MKISEKAESVAARHTEMFIFEAGFGESPHQGLSWVLLGVFACGGTCQVLDRPEMSLAKMIIAQAQAKDGRPCHTLL